MSDRLFWSVLFGAVFLLFVIAGIAIWMLLEHIRKGFAQTSSDEIEDAEHKHQRRLIAKARRICGPKACCKCKNWDLDSGQAAIAANPNFMIAARQLSPNKMGRRADDASAPSLPIALDKWELFGACTVASNVVHATDTCDSFQKV